MGRTSVMNETTVTTLYCIIDDFINALEKTSCGQKMLESWEPKRGPQRQLALSEVLTFIIIAILTPDKD